ncbi:hypothetical protein K2173_021099 [Erythroxylum novogranatense]|uniref:Uncharacterized protein n=1 Tax=Erythroxylum novogranatense TaxID=1862640 RepID=A0AAV8TPT8_9ROSI|nr:hypothetical protein K2173_021099 [Erythroxylum novogranatense]
MVAGDLVKVTGGRRFEVKACKSFRIRARNLGPGIAIPVWYPRKIIFLSLGVCLSKVLRIFSRKPESNPKLKIVENLDADFALEFGTAVWCHSVKVKRSSLQTD